MFVMTDMPIHAAIVLVCAAACGTPPFHLLGAAPGSMALLCGTTAGIALNPFLGERHTSRAKSS
jgi:hypothetical protein